jgi:N-acetylglucosamine malate deacetylase 1
MGTSSAAGASSSRCRNRPLFDGGPKRILIVAPHPDDESLGAGGTAAKLAAAGHEVTILVVSGHLPPLYPQEAYDRTVREARAAFEILSVASHRFLGIPATFVSGVPVHELNGMITGVVEEVQPHVVLCNYPDRHIDHRVIFESVMVATRPVKAGRGISLVAAYETLSETHWNAPHVEPGFIPNWVVDITDFIDAKLRAVACYESQVSGFPGPRSVEAVEALAKFRGTQWGFAFGEAFQILRMTS